MTLRDKTIIVVEDTYDDVQLISAILAHARIKVKIAKNGVDCLEQVKDLDPVMIVTDLAMPQMDGWEMLKQLRSNPDTASIPVVAITAYYSVDVAQDAYEAGFNGYFAKPVHPTRFVEELHEILE